MVCFRNSRRIIKYKWKTNGGTVDLLEEFCYIVFRFEAGEGSELSVRKRIEWISKVIDPCGASEREISRTTRR